MSLNNANAGGPKPRLSYQDVDACIDEIEWYATRAKNLAEGTTMDSKPITWGQMMLSDLADLRKALADERSTDSGEAK